MRRTRLVALGVACLAVGLPAAGHGQSVAELEVNPQQLQLMPGERREALATAYDARGNTLSNVDFQWASANPQVATVEKDATIPGVAYIVGVGPGVTQVEVRVGRITKSVTVSVSAAAGPVGTGQPTIIEIDPPQVLLLPTEELRLSPRFLKDDGSLAAPVPVTWRSYNEGVASVTQDGRVIGIAPGNTLVEAAAAGLPARRITVQVQTTNWAFQRPVLSLSPTRSDTVRVVVPAQNNRRLNPRQLSWRSTNSNVVDVTPIGVATGVAAGEAEIVAIGFGQQNAVPVKVHRPVEFLAVKRYAFEDTVLVPLGGVTRFDVEPQAADESPIPEAPVLWEVGDTTVLVLDAATQEARGRRLGVTSLKVGTADPAVPSKTWAVRVVATGLVLDVDRRGIGLGARLPVRAFFADSQGNRLAPATSVTWTSSRPRVATVDEQGVVTAADFGMAHIVAATPWGNADTALVYVQGALLIASDRSGTYDIYSVDPSRPDRVNPVITGPGRKASPAYSPDGSRIVYVSDEPGNFEIYVAHADGAERRRLTTTTAAEGSPVWSPDGRRIFYESDAGGAFNIWSMNPDGSDQRQLTQTAAPGTVNIQPAVSPGGRNVAFTSTRDGNSDIYLMNPDGTNQRNFSSSPDQETFAAWIGDTAVAFLRETRRGRETSRAVVSMNLQRQFVELAPATLPITDFAVTSDASLIAVVASIPGPTGQAARRIYLIPLGQGGEPREVQRVSDSEQLITPAFRP